MLIRNGRACLVIFVAKYGPNVLKYFSREDYHITIEMRESSMTFGRFQRLGLE
jgi:hypothetical protein